MRPAGLRSPRFWLLGAALAALFVVLLRPAVDLVRQRYDLLVVVDITRSMNVRDYQFDGAAASRLDFVKAGLRAFMLESPCQSKIGLGIFTNRQSFVLFEPLEICANFALIVETLEAIDWRMAWQGDSGITYGLHSAHGIAAALDVDLVFLTDGQEAPPLPLSGPPPFRGEAGAVAGLIGGIGGREPAPIPKYDEDGREIGFLGVEDVPHESRLGPPPEDAHLREGWHPRNAPWGAGMIAGTEHLSSVREDHLRERAAATQLAYAHLQNVPDFVAALRDALTPRPAVVRADLRWLPASVALACLLLVYALPLALRLAKAARPEPSPARIHLDDARGRRPVPRFSRWHVARPRADATPDLGERRHRR